MPNHGQKLVDAALNLLLPCRCVLCGTVIPQPGFCPGCRADLPGNSRCCHACACPLVDDTSLCASCQRNPLPLIRILAPLRYEFPVDAALKALKFRAHLHYVPAFAALILEATEQLSCDIDAVIAMPMHWRRRATRGFNQAEELAQPVARQLRVPLLSCVRRVRNTRFQSALDVRGRRQNLLNAFRATGRVDARHVLVVDDIMTTGESLKRLAIELRRAGVGRVSALVVARAGGNA